MKWFVRLLFSILVRNFNKLAFLLLLGMSYTAHAEDLFLPSTYERANDSCCLVAITAYYDESRLQYLSQVLSSLGSFPKADIIVLTNTFDEKELANLNHVCTDALHNRTGNVSFSIRSYPVDPALGGKGSYYLTWSHKDIIKNEFAPNEYYSHFIYLEDDMEFRWDNFLYLLEYRELLRDKHFLPSLLRVEHHSIYDDFTYTDSPDRIKVSERPRFMLGDMMCLNLYNPYMACFLLDHELADEYICSASFDVELSTMRTGWPIRERANAGLCFENIPKPYSNRYVVIIDPKTGRAPAYTWIRHLPNNYANSSWCGGYGKTRMSELFDCSTPGTPYPDDRSVPAPYDTVKTLLPFNEFGWYSNDWQLKQLIEERRVKTIIEVGSFLGLSTRALASYLPTGGVVYAIDHWLGSIEHQPNGWASTPTLLPQLYQQFLSNVIHAGLTHKIIPVRMDSTEAASKLSITADLIFIDASHDEDSVYKDLVAWYPHLNSGGLLAGDDWLFGTVQQGVRRFVVEHPELSLHTDGNFFCFFLKKS